MKVPNFDFLARHLDGERKNEPKGYIGWVKSWPKYDDGFLASLPSRAIIVNDSRIEDQLAIMGISTRHIRKFETGTASPNQLLVVYSDQGQPTLLINRGLPGGGGITTQAAELYELGVEEIVHIGTCALMGDDVVSKRIILSKGSYKDEAALLVSMTNKNGVIDPLAYPDKDLSTRILCSLSEQNHATAEAFGFTISSFYFQPTSLIKDLILNTNLPSKQAVGFLEMEQAGLFSVAERMGKRAASMVVGSDRYSIEDGQLNHTFEAEFDQDLMERQMMLAAAASMGADLPMRA